MLDREVSNLPRDETPLDEGDICPDEASVNKNVVNPKSINRILFYFYTSHYSERQTDGWLGWLFGECDFRGSDTGFVCSLPGYLAFSFEGTEPGCPTFTMRAA